MKNGKKDSSSLDLSNIMERNKGKQCLCPSKYYYCCGITNVIC